MSFIHQRRALGGSQHVWSCVTTATSLKETHPQLEALPAPGSSVLLSGLLLLNPSCQWPSCLLSLLTVLWFPPED